MAIDPDGFRPFPIDWRFLPDPALEIKDWLRAKWIDAVRIEERPPRLQRLWGASLARHWVIPVVKAGILFIHIPRTAGTSISSQLYGRNLPHLTTTTWNGLLGKARRDLPSFSIIREPLERLISLYAFIRQGGTMLMAAPRYDPWKLSSAGGFEDFLARLWDLDAGCSTPTYLAPQLHCLLDRTGHVAVDRLFSFRSAGGLPEQLSYWLGLAPIPHLNASRPIEVDVSPSLRSKMERHYAAEFEIFQRVEDSGGMLCFQQRRSKAIPEKHRNLPER